MNRRRALSASVMSGGGGLCIAYIAWTYGENSEPFFFESGMTWRDFVNSEYNEFDLKVNTYGNVISKQSNRLWTFGIKHESNNNYVTPDELIIINNEYLYN